MKSEIISTSPWIIGENDEEYRIAVLKVYGTPVVGACYEVLHEDIMPQDLTPEIENLKARLKYLEGLIQDALKAQI